MGINILSNSQASNANEGTIIKNGFVGLPRQYNYEKLRERAQQPTHRQKYYLRELIL